MAYSKTTWVNGGPPALSAENLNKMEDSIYDSSDGRISLDTTAASSTTDGALYAAIVALGWQSDVID